MSNLGLKRGWTQFPNLLIDLYMPKMSDTEWRLLCVIVRKTIGWRQAGSGERLGRVRLSHRQLRRLTGRQSASLSHALHVLVDEGFLVVTDAAGHRLSSPHERQRSRQALTFSLATWISDFSTTSKKVNSKKQKQLKDTRDK